MPFSPRRLSPIVMLALLVGPTTSYGVRVSELLGAVGAAGRFTAPVTADGTLAYRDQDGADVSETFRLFGRGSTLRVEFGDVRALVRNGKALVATGGGAAQLGLDATLGPSNVLLGDLGVFAPAMLRMPQIVDEGLSGTVVASDPAGASPYTLLVYTIDSERAVITHTKYYQWSINNLVKRDRRNDFVLVAGALRPQRISVYDVQGTGTSEITLAWTVTPHLPPRAFTRAGLAEPIAP